MDHCALNRGKRYGPTFLSIWLAFFVLLLPLCAHAITATPGDHYRTATAAEVEAIKSTGFWQSYTARDEAVLRVLNYVSDETDFYLVRMESDYCNGNRCMTGIFKGRISGEGLQSWGALPPFVARGEKGRLMCDGCEPLYPLIFYSDPKKSRSGRTIYLWRHGVFFGPKYFVRDR